MVLRPLLLLLGPALVVGEAHEGQGQLEATFGFTADLVVAAPELSTPSCVFAFEDGSLMVGEAGGRVVRISFGRGVTSVDVYAEGLGPVRGLEQIDGDLFVLHGRRLSRLSDPNRDGRVDERERIVDGLGPEPGPDADRGGEGANALRMSLDGFLYLSVGERGIPRATGRDDSTLTLRGAGVVRMRPDGTELEVYARGTGRHAGLGLGQHGDLFVYEARPGGRVRLAHVVEDGDYGFPFELDGEPSRALGAMQEYEGGAPGGGLVYTGGTLKGFRDQLFWCEPERGALRQFEIERAEGTFRVFHAEDFVTAGTVEDFRPIDVCTSADGRCFYVADAGGEKGRIWRVRLEGDDPDRPTAMRPLPVVESSLVDTLADHNFRRRLAAQRAVGNLEPDELIVDLLYKTATENQNEQKRRHALWALTELDRELARDAAVYGFGSTEDTQVQALRAFGSHARLPHEDMLPLMKRGTPRVRREAAAALGRIGRPDGVDHIAAAHGLEADPLVRWAIRRALARIGVWNDEVIDWVSLSSNPDAELLLALRDVYDPRAVEHLAGLVNGAGDVFPDEWAERLASQRARVLAVLAELHRRPEPWDGRWWGPRPHRFPPPARTVVWKGTPLVTAAVHEALFDPSVPVRRAALEAMRTLDDSESAPVVRARVREESEDELRLLALEVLGDLGDVDAAPLLAELVDEAGGGARTKLAAIATARRVGGPGAIDLLLDVAGRADVSSAVRVEAMRGLGELRVAAAEPLLVEGLSSSRGVVRAVAVRSVVRVAGARAVELIAPLLGDRSTEVRLAAVAALSELGSSGVPALLEVAETEGVRDAALRALAELHDPRALDVFLRALERPAVSSLARVALMHLRDDVREELERRLAAGELGPDAIDALPEILVAPAPLHEWTLHGPFRPGAAEMRVSERDLHFASEGRPARAGLADGSLDVASLLSAAQDGDVFCVSSFETDELRELELVIGSDDAIDVWVDGALVHAPRARRHWAPDQDRVVVEVGAGEHQVVVRCAAYARISVARVGRGEGAFFEATADAGRSPEVVQYAAFAEEHPGDSARGFQLFRDARRVSCTSCHTIATPRGRLGERIGPDLDTVGDRLERADLVEALLEPSRHLARGFETEVLHTSDGRRLSGLVISEADGGLRLLDSYGDVHEIPTERVTRRGPGRGSVMPADLYRRVSPEGFVDLVAFLESLGRSSGREGAARSERR